MAEYTGEVDGLGVLRLLDAVRTCGLTKKVRFYQASTSELYGQVVEIPQRETTPFYPRSPYGTGLLSCFSSFSFEANSHTHLALTLRCGQAVRLLDRQELP